MEPVEAGLRELLSQARQRYDALVGRERALLAELDDIRIQRYRQEGFIASLEMILGATEGHDGTQEEVDSVGHEEDGAEGNGRLIAQGSRKEVRRNNNGGRTRARAKRNPRLRKKAQFALNVRK